jgi:hypothetical protein
MELKSAAMESGIGTTHFLLYSLSQRLSHIRTLDALHVPAFCPSLEDSVVESVLSGWVAEGEAQGNLALAALNIIALGVLADEAAQAISDMVEQSICCACLDVFWQVVLLLDHI